MIITTSKWVVGQGYRVTIEGYSGHRTYRNVSLKSCVRLTRAMKSLGARQSIKYKGDNGTVILKSRRSHR